MVNRSKLEREWAAKVLLTLVTDTQVRHKNGIKLRARMLEEMEKGGTLTGYRPPWIRQSAHRIIELLHTITTEFNDQHSTDQASITDMLDILSTTSHLLQKAQTEISPTLIQPKQPRSLV